MSSDARGPVVAIDGPAGAGKSTLARRLAVALNLPYVNTGLMYRAVTDRALASGVATDDEPALASMADEISFGLADRLSQGLLELTIDGAAPDPFLVRPEVEAAVSAVSRHPRVRDILRARQRSLGHGGAVMEGRDIGSVVFPDANVKIFLQATPATRARRRARERVVTGGDEVSSRDALDARTTPLAPAAGAIVLDTTALTPDEVLARALELSLPVVDRARRGQEAETTSPAGHPSVEGAESDHSSTVTGGLPVVAVVGRQNVGKSTLVNRLAGRRIAIAHEQPGVTRDRVEVPVRWDGRGFVVSDTGGFVIKASGVEESARRQAELAMRTADLILLVVDAQSGVQEEDAYLADRLRKAARPVLVVANKVDAERMEPDAFDFMRLGLGDPIPVSALHGRGSDQLLDRILDLLPHASGEPQEEIELRFCLVGRPNVGKSSLFNRLVNEERAVVHEEAGTTRDAVDSVVRVRDRRIRFVDTAGLRPQVRTQGVEYYGLLRSFRAIERAHVALLVVDAAEGLTGEDKRIAARIVEAGRGLVAALNKWDLIPTEERADRFRDLGVGLELFPGTPVVRTSALTGLGVGRIVPALMNVHDSWSRRVSTSDVNRELEAALGAHPPPRTVGRIKYATQVSAGPPTFVLFGGGLPDKGYRRYLEHRLRGAFGFEGVPVRLSFRAGGRRRRGPKPGRRPAR
jgi:GTP-binding protein